MNAFNNNKIKDFRNLVNSNSNFVQKKYESNDNKNQWNIICSCMDWISVSVNYLKNLSITSNIVDVHVMQMFSLISSVDIVFESITQLHRIFINTKSLPRKGENICFSEKIFDIDDNNYFKEIRAAFGAHPVNLNHSGSKRFASWPFESNITSDGLSVILYSNKIDEDDLVMTIRPIEIISFFERTYNYLDVISERINELYENYRVALRKKPIETSAIDLEQLKLLKKASIERLDNDYYNDIIDELIIIFKVEDFDSEIEILVSKYRSSLEPLIKEIKNNLQNVDIVDLKNDYLLNIDSDIKSVLRYELGKFNQWIYTGKNDPLLEYCLKRFNEVTDNRFSFDIKDSVNLLLIKSKLMLTYTDKNLE